MNLWLKLIGLFPQPARIVGTIAQVLGTGYYLVTLTGGGQILAYGPTGLTVATQVFVVDGTIEGTAPALTPEVIEV